MLKKIFNSYKNATLRGIIMKKLICLFVLFSNLHLAHFKLISQEAKPHYYTQESFSDRMSMPSEWILELYQLMKDTHEILVQHKIDYWIQGGTLLGAVRHKGLIPWDDDIDINLKLTDEAAFRSLIPEFVALNYHIDVVPLGYKIVSPNIYDFPPLKGGPCIDVFFTVQEGDKIMYDSTRDVNWMHRDKGRIYITPNELYPLRMYRLGECYVLGPNDPIPFLDACFGTDWPNKAICWNHFFAVEKNKKVITLTDDDKLPAEPTGPLYDRVKTTKKVRIYANMIGDLFHYGHMEFLKKASKLGTELIVGLVSDEVAAEYKRKPILSLPERVKSVQGCKYVHEVISDTPLVINEAFLLLHHIDYVVHGDDFDLTKLETYFLDPLLSNKMRIIPYTPGISTTEIIDRIQSDK